MNTTMTPLIQFLNKHKIKWFPINLKFYKDKNGKDRPNGPALRPYQRGHDPHVWSVAHFAYNLAVLLLNHRAELLDAVRVSSRCSADLTCQAGD